MNQGLNELITYECLSHNWLWVEEFQDVRLSMLSCYSPGRLDSVDSTRSTAWKTEGGAETKRKMKGFTLNCNTSRLKEQLILDAYCPTLLRVKLFASFWKGNICTIINNNVNNFYRHSHYTWVKSLINICDTMSISSNNFGHLQDSHNTEMAAGKPFNKERLGCNCQWSCMEKPYLNMWNTGIKYYILYSICAFKKYLHMSLKDRLD